MSIKYIITTTPRYTQPLNHLLDSMYICDINPTDIILSCQNTYANIEYYSYSIFNKLLKFNIDQNIFEYTFFITCMKLLNAGIVSTNDHFLLIHDTTILLHYHQERLKLTTQLIQQYDIVMGDIIGRYNIGIYNTKSIIVGYNLWKNIDCISKQQGIDIEHNRLYYENNNNNLSIKNNSLVKTYFPHVISSLHHGVEVYCPKNLRVTGTLDMFAMHKYFFYVDGTQQHPNSP